MIYSYKLKIEKGRADFMNLGNSLSLVSNNYYVYIMIFVVLLLDIQF